MKKSEKNKRKQSLNGLPDLHTRNEIPEVYRRRMIELLKQELAGESGSLITYPSNIGDILKKAIKRADELLD
jgi:hypothetical protein